MAAIPEPATNPTPTTRPGRRPTRIILFTYAVYAALEGVRLGWLWSYPLSAVARFTLPVAAAIAVVLALGGAGDAVRRSTIGFGLAVVGLQFLLAFGTFTPWIGLVLAVALVVGLRPRAPRLTRAQRRHALFVHVASSVGWLGLALAMTVLSVLGLTSSSDELAGASYDVMHVFDVSLVIPLVVVSILSGVLLSMMTTWGLVRHWWVLIKLVISLTIVAVAAFYENFLVRGLADEPTDHGDQVGLAACMIGFTLLLVTATALSTYKPGGRTPWSRPHRGGGTAPTPTPPHLAIDGARPPAGGTESSIPGTGSVNLSAPLDRPVTSRQFAHDISYGSGEERPCSDTSTSSVWR